MSKRLQAVASGWWKSGIGRGEEEHCSLSISSAASMLFDCLHYIDILDQNFFFF